MKLFLGIAIGLIVGVALGWIAGYVHPNRKAIRQLERYTEKVRRDREPEGTTTAVYAIKGVQLIAAGMTNEAIKVLSHPIARYYEFYASDLGTNQYRRRMREVIDELARTNQIVSESLARKWYDGMVPVWIEGMEGYAWVGVVTNSKSNGDTDGPANGSQPIRSETNRASLPAGSGR